MKIVELRASGRRPARSLLFALFSGLLGGGMAVVIVATGDIGSRVTTTVLMSPVTVAGSLAHASEGSVYQIYEHDALGVVSVNASGVAEDRSTSELLKGEESDRGPVEGAGCEIGDDGTIITNWHVVSGASKITVRLGPKKTVEARLVGDEPSNDIALLRIPTNGLTLHPLTLGDSNATRVGDPVLTIGNPFGLERSLTTGVISGLERRITAPNGATITGAIQIDAPINPGNSGGPLLNERGEVIGINSQLETGGSGDGSVGVGFAIPIDAVKRLLPSLEHGR